MTLVQVDSKLGNACHFSIAQNVSDNVIFLRTLTPHLLTSCRGLWGDSDLAATAQGGRLGWEN